MHRVGVAGGVFGGPDRFASIAALFPQVAFESLGPGWPRPWDSGFEIVVVGLDASSPDTSAALTALKSRPAGLSVVVVLQDADVTTTRQLIREGAADVLPSPVSEAAVALCLERLFASRAATAAPPSPSGEVVAVLKAGGGVGATSVIVQAAAMMAAKGGREICVADLDLQFGAAALYLDLPEAVSVSDLLTVRTPLADAPFGEALARHHSGLRVLAAPRDIVALEALNASEADGLLRGLRNQFALTLVDLPPVWTEWSNQILSGSDKIVLVTQLSVPHIQLVKRQLRVLASQQLDDRPVVLVCNGLSRDQQQSLSLKAAEKALGRAFDVVIPEDRRLMMAAINEGVELASLRRGTKIEKSLGELASLLAPADASLERARR